MSDACATDGSHKETDGPEKDHSPGTDDPECRFSSGLSGAVILLSNRWLLLAVVPLFLFMAVEAYFSIRFASDERAEQAWVLHTYSVIDLLRSITSHVEEAEAGQRGYIITRQDHFLVPYKAGIEKTRSDLDAFQSSTVDNPQQQTRAAKLKRLVDDRFAALSATLSQSSVAVAQSPSMLAAMEQGKERMDELQSELARGTAEERKLLSTRLGDRRSAERSEIISTGITAVVALLVMLGTALLLVRSNARLAKSESKLANESAILQTTIDTIREGIAMFASDGELCVFNERFLNIFSLPRELISKGAVLSEFQAYDRSRGLQVFGDTALLTLEGEHQHHHLSMNGRELDIYRAAVPTGGFVIVGMDVTARVQAELVARQAQKMESIGRLTGGVAHDFNNILQIIGANLERIAHGVRDQPQSRERVKNSLNAVANGARLTGQLLAFARRQPLNPRSTNVGRIVQDMTDLLGRTLGEPVEVECIVGGGLWNTLIDPGQIESAILNLAINSRDAMPGGGKLTIEVANAFLDDAYAAQHLEVASGQYVMVAISDTGAGMSTDTLARAFEPFFTTKAEGRGTGLGLSQVYGFVKQSGGHIKIYSEYGQGTTVKLYLPRTRKPQESAGHMYTQPVRGGSERILIVEDDESVRNVVMDMVSELGYAVLKAENAEQALVVLESGVAIDLLFTDVIMPGSISTRELARRAQEIQPNIKILYTSGYTQNAIVHNGKLDDDASLLSKPYGRDDLARKFRSLLDARISPVQEGQVEGVTRTPTPPRGKVLVVEDVALIRLTTVDMIEEIGFKAIESSNGIEALSALRDDPDISVLITDLGLPGMSGQQLIDEALNLRPDLKVIIASGYSSDRETLNPRTVGNRLTKPFDIEQLRRALEA